MSFKLSDPTQSKTLIIITHRLATVTNCDNIFFVDKGKIIKEGNPKDVLQSSKKSGKVI